LSHIFPGKVSLQAFNVKVGHDDEFRNDRDKQIQWSAFLRRNKIEVTFDFKDVVKFIEKFLAPVLSPSDADMKWNPLKLEWIK
jgi:hypothetical protein